MKTQDSLENIKCIKNSEAIFSCLNKNCQKYAFVCRSQECQCHRGHENCLMAKAGTIIKSLKAKVISTKQLESCVQSCIEKLIDQLSDFRDKALIEIKNKFQIYGLSQGEKLVLSQMKEGNTKKITGSQMWQAHLDFQKEQQIVALTQKAIEQIKLKSRSFENLIQTHCNDIQKLIEQLQSSSRVLLEKKYSNIFIKDRLSEFKLSYYNLVASKIISTSEESKAILDFFTQKKVIKSCKLLYKTSQSGFDVGKFHEKCDNIPNTLTLCETEFGKKIGGYTPIPWKIGSGSYVRDESGESFLFSLSNKDKFILQDKDKAVYHHKNNDRGPDFGGGNGTDFCISQKSNQNNSSASYINCSYINNKYKYNDKESFQRFNGNPQGSSSFKVKEWEVWQIQFQT